MSNEKQTQILIFCVIIGQIFIELLDQLLISPFAKGNLKPIIRQLIKYLSPIVEKWYLILFEKSEMDVQGIITNQEGLIKLIYQQEMPDSIMLSSMIQAWHKDKKSIEGIIKKVLKDE